MKHGNSHGHETHNGKTAKFSVSRWFLEVFNRV